MPNSREKQNARFLDSSVCMINSVTQFKCDILLTGGACNSYAGVIVTHELEIVFSCRTLYKPLVAHFTPFPAPKTLPREYRACRYLYLYIPSVTPDSAECL